MKRGIQEEEDGNDVRKAAVALRPPVSHAPRREAETPGVPGDLRGRTLFQISSTPWVPNYRWIGLVRPGLAALREASSSSGLRRRRERRGAERHLFVHIRRSDHPSVVAPDLYVCARKLAGGSADQRSRPWRRIFV
jgi:hypothetical protein